MVKTIPTVRARPCRDRLVQPEERDLLLAAAPPALRCYLLLCSDLALRAATACAVSPRHVDLTSNTVQIVTKGQTLVTLPISQRLRPLLEAACTFAPSGDGTPVLVHLGAPRTRWLKASMAAAFQRLRVALNLPHFTSHDLRRSTARAVYLSTGDLREAQAVLGHSALRTTLDYLESPLIAPRAASIEAAIARKGKLQ